MNNNNVIVAVNFPRNELTMPLEFEFDTATLMSLGDLHEHSPLERRILSDRMSLELLALDQTVDDLQQLVWP